MPKTVQVSVPTKKSDALVPEIQKIDGLIGLRLQRGVSLRPPGDVISVEITNRSLPVLMDRLVAHGIGVSAGSSITTSEPVTVVSASSVQQIVRDSSDASWEEMEGRMSKDSNMTLNALLLMAASGIIAAIGIATNALHVVIGAMLVAPGFEPITRIGLGVVARSAAWLRGLADLMKGYAVLILAAMAMTLVLQALGKDPPQGEATYLASGELASYWTTITPSSVVVSAVAAIAGALLVATNRSVLTGGVMVALALVPAATLVGMGTMSRDGDIVVKALLRFGVDVVLVGGLAAVVFLWKRMRLQKRDMML